MKSWSYNQITKHTENEIIELMKSNDSYKQLMAYGVFWGWYTLTTGWQKDGDRQRIEALMENIKRSKKGE